MNTDGLSSYLERSSAESEALDDVSLIKASQQRNQEAFALLVCKYQRPLFTLAWYILLDEEEASTITQDTFLAAWPGDADVLLWLSRLIY
jgi:hypothetical protein